MIVVSGTLEFAADGVEAARAATTAMAVATRQEVGCRTYAFFQEIETPTRFRVFEEWDDDATLQAHAKTDHMATFRATLREIGVLNRDITLYRVTGTEAL